jgi:hypothetical protein
MEMVVGWRRLDLCRVQETRWKGECNKTLGKEGGSVTNCSGKDARREWLG